MGWQRDLVLLKAWRAGEPESGEQLVREHYGVVRRFFASKTPEAIDDLVQSTFLACVKASTPLQRGVRFQAMVLGFARIELLRYLRQRAQIQRRDQRLQKHVAHLARPTSPPTWLARARRKRDVELALRRLPLDLQLTVELFYWEELSVAEVAHVLDVPSGTVKSRLSRARRLLKRKLHGTRNVDHGLHPSSPLRQSSDSAG